MSCIYDKYDIFLQKDVDVWMGGTSGRNYVWNDGSREDAGSIVGGQEYVTPDDGIMLVMDTSAMHI